MKMNSHFLHVLWLFVVVQVHGDIIYSSNASDLFVRTPDNGVEHIASELRAPTTLKAIAEKSKVPEDVLSVVKFDSIRIRDYFEGGGRSIDLSFDSSKVKVEDARAIMRVVESYVDNRCLGHTASFALEQLLTFAGGKSTLPHIERIVDAFPKAPVQRLKAVPKGLDPALDRDETYGYIDGDFLWIYQITGTGVYDGRVPLLQLQSIKERIPKELKQTDDE